MEYFSFEWKRRLLGWVFAKSLSDPFYSRFIGGRDLHVKNCANRLRSHCTHTEILEPSSFLSPYSLLRVKPLTMCSRCISRSLWRRSSSSHFLPSSESQSSESSSSIPKNRTGCWATRLVEGGVMMNSDSSRLTPAQEIKTRQKFTI